MTDPAALTVGTAQQMRRVLRTVFALRLDCGYVSRPTTLRHASNHDFGYTQPAKRSPIPANTGDPASTPQKLPSNVQRRLAPAGTLNAQEEMPLAATATTTMIIKMN
jgi:hypothetical protein